MISDAELARLKELALAPLSASKPLEALREYAEAAGPATVLSLIADIEMLKHENATCASALMIANDALKAAEKERAEMEAAACDTVEKLYTAEGRAEVAEAELAALLAELEQRK